MKLPKDMPFVILDRNMYGTQAGARLTEDFIEWLVRDCAKVCLNRAKKMTLPAAYGADLSHDDILARYGLEP